MDRSRRGAKTRGEHGRADAAPRLVIVSGVSGSGRATAMRVLEDLGFYCVDNLPVGIAATVMHLTAEHSPPPRGVALGIDARERIFFARWPLAFAELEKQGFKPEVIFLDASDEVLARRYSESRRPHPLAEAGATIADSIRRERKALRGMRERAARVIDTSTTTVHELREIVAAAVLGVHPGARMRVSIVSFGFKYGPPAALDLMFDARFVPNPFFVPELSALDGLNSRVRAFIMRQPEARRFLDETARLLGFLLPLYRREGKSYLTIGLGCTGGRHRSPMLAAELTRRLRAAGHEVELRHQDIAR